MKPTFSGYCSTTLIAFLHLWIIFVSIQVSEVVVVCSPLSSSLMHASWLDSYWNNHYFHSLIGPILHRHRPHHSDEFANCKTLLCSLKIHLQNQRMMKSKNLSHKSKFSVFLRKEKLQIVHTHSSEGNMQIINSKQRRVRTEFQSLQNQRCRPIGKHARLAKAAMCVLAFELSCWAAIDRHIIDEFYRRSEHKL